MAKKLFTAIFVFAGFVFAQGLSLEEELRLLGGDIFFIADPEPALQSAVNDTAQSLPQDSAHVQVGETSDTDAGAVGGGSRGGPMHGGFSSPVMGRGAGGGGRGPDADESPRVSIFDTAGVASEHYIDFTRNVTDYRSPQRALFFSLLLPGLGQAYNRDFVRAGIYAAAEIGMISGAIFFRKRSQRRQEEARSFADSHFSEERLVDFYRELAEWAQANPVTVFTDRGDTIVLTTGERIFGTNSQLSDFDGISELTDGFLKLFNEDRYGSSFGLGGSFGVRGWWDDVSPSNVGIYSLNDDLDIVSSNGLFISFRGGSFFGTSARQREFHGLMDLSRDDHRRSSVFVVGIFMNHIASAADAFVSAIIHNRRLLREERGEVSSRAQDIISRISLDSDLYIDGISGDFTSRLGFTWRF